MVPVKPKPMMVKIHPKNLKNQNHRIKKNKMKYQCSKCNFSWEGTSHTFDKVRIHEKTHDEQNDHKMSREK